MREDIEANLKVIRKYLIKRKKSNSKLNNASIMEEFKEWSKDPLPETEAIWTLPDLTRNERLKEKVKIKKFDSNQPIGAWIFVFILNIVGFAGYFYLKVNHIQLGS